MTPAAGAAQVLQLTLRDSRGRVLVEASQTLPGGKTRRRNILLSEKMLPSEGWQAAARRAVAEELGSLLPAQPGGGGDLVAPSGHTERFVRKDSPSYPGPAPPVTPVTLRPPCRCCIKGADAAWSGGGRRTGRSACRAALTQACTPCTAWSAAKRRRRPGCLRRMPLRRPSDGRRAPSSADGSGATSRRRRSKAGRRGDPQ